MEMRFITCKCYLMSLSPRRSALKELSLTSTKKVCLICTRITVSYLNITLLRWPIRLDVTIYAVGRGEELGPNYAQMCVLKSEGRERFCFN